ncbi:MAG: hypothetical protein L0G27_02815 [Paracoccus sp. (in: a-proteobacteria)]|nr:hypothetical protein [Paracoccus sp. (in: a-proteobacteria)]
MLTILWLGAALAVVPAHQDRVANDLAQFVPVQVQADATAPNVQDRMWRVLGLGPQMQIFQKEAAQDAAQFEADGLIGGTGEPWADTVSRIHAPHRLQALFRKGLANGLARADARLLNQGLGFYERGLGQRLVPLETSARMAMLDDDVAANAQEAFARATDQGDPRAAQIDRLIRSADLVAPNVSSGLNASVAFSRGFGEGGGFDMPLSDGQMLAETWAQQDQIEAETIDWLQSFLMLAYSPLSDAELDDYITYAASPEGQTLAQLMFAAYDSVFLQTSYDMGLAAALRLQGRQL